MKKLIALALALAMVFAFAACGSKPADPAPANTAAPSANTQTPAADPAQPDTNEADSHDDWIELDLSFATYLTENNPMQENMIVLQQKLDEYMPGKVTITTYANGTLLKGADIYDGILNGTCDIGVVQPDYTPARFPLCKIFSYPGIVYNSAEVATRVFDEWARTSGAAEMEDAVFLMGVGSGPYCIFTKEPITDISDLNGKQIRAGGVNAELISSYGATPVTMDISEVYEAMRSGLIDGLYTNYGACAFQNLEEVGTYALVTPLSSNPSFYAMNKDVFNSMPASQQEAFMQACRDTFEQVTAKYQDAGLMVDRVVTFASKTDRTYLEGDMLAEFEEAGGYLMDELAAELDAQGVDGTGTVAMVRELADKYNELMTWDDYKACYPEDMDPSNN